MGGGAENGYVGEGAGWGASDGDGFVLKGDSIKQISTLCVRMLLPVLLVIKVGSQLHADTGIRYVSILSKLLSSNKKHKEYGLID